MALPTASDPKVTQEHKGYMIEIGLRGLLRGAVPERDQYSLLKRYHTSAIPCAELRSS